ncbi:mandelate racemase/muconate lactonizing enzyme family protein [Ochrobactrum teleogrylli]|uniref:Mandelate racemase/muconate lactonizing enzyme family protein n=1 Tax=Ochrobactrum teleogrylli TaxID=2479765 RepID=A0ABD5K6M0_9HYPH
MKINEIRLYHLSAPLAEPIGNAKVFFDRRETLLVEVVAGSDSGWGETWALPTAAASLIEVNLAPHVLGQDAQHYRRIWQDMCRPFETRSGVAMMAISALDMAIHDLAAKQQGIPLHVLLGGARRDRVPTYASGPFFKPGGHPYRDFERDVESYLADGFKSIKLRSGYRPADDASAALTVRKMIGGDGDLMIDFNQSITVRNAISTFELLAEAQPLWIEEPTVPVDLAGYKQASAHIKCAIAGGETFASARDFLPFLNEGVMDVLQPDIAICGGFNGVEQVAVLADIYGRPLIPHVWGSIVNFQAALHLTATLPAYRGGRTAFPFMEYDVGPNPLLDLVGRPRVGADGTLPVPSTPGLGIDISQDLIAPYIVRSCQVA